MSIDRETVKKVAKLARLKLTAEEEEKYTKQLSGILDYVDQLKNMPGSAASADLETSHSLEELREDAADGGRHREQILNGAPTRKGDLLSVPGVFE